ncbi:iron-sulfur cluster assembly protein [Methylocystis bryophila]|uniref:iron-sulfur cluster assembly protein n=1 Tax=Methylocystis bryophila TaxID=655015 RepID=UPI001FD9B137|nr:iron-sulfur cluster assembly protein [Methylocystis bryophila]BDV36930.1 SUF system Fe-S cluster assembly protein [Methylocystis bryophila]
MEAETTTEAAVTTASTRESDASRPAPEAVHAAVVAALREVFDPEIPVNIYDLGLVYKIDIINRCHVEVDMTLTAPGCPVAGEMMNMTKRAIDGVECVASSKVNLVFDPPWSQAMMSDEAKLDLGFFGD